MKKHQLSHSPDFSHAEHREKPGEHLSDFAVLPNENKCTILVPLTGKPGERRKGDAVEESISGDNVIGEVMPRYRGGTSPKKGILMPSEDDLARAIEKISRLSDAQLTWFIHQMQHLGFSPCDEMSQNQAQQSK